MLSARRALSRSKQTGRPLPEVPAFHDLYNGHFKFRFRGGETTVIGGQSGSQKSGLALFLVSQWAQLGLTGLYISADMAQHTATARLVAAVSGDTTETVFKGLSAGAEDYYGDYLEDLQVRFVFNPNPDFHDIQEEVDAWVETWDEYPNVIVLDNLLDIVPSAGDNEFTGYKSILLDAKTLARTTGASVLVLHHMSEAGTNPTEPAPKKALLGKVSQTPENILSVAKDGDEFRISVVKARSSQDDPTGQAYERFTVHPDRNTFERRLPSIGVPQHTYWQQSPGEDAA